MTECTHIHVLCHGLLFCVLRSNEAFISCTRVLPFGSPMLSYAQCSPVSSVFSLPYKEQALSPSIVMINQADCHHFWIIINCYLLLLLMWVLLNHSHEAHYIRQMLNFLLGHNIHVPIHGLCNQLFLYSQSNQAECCHLFMLFSASTKLWKALSHLFICMSVCPSVRIQLSFFWMDFHEIWYESFSEVCWENPSYIKIWLE